MDHVIDMSELDGWIWSQLESSQHPQDLIDFAAHARGRVAPIETALDRAVELQHPGDATALGPDVLTQIEARAQEGSLPAILSAARWRFMGLGCDADDKKAFEWLDHGARLGYAACLTLRGRFVAQSDTKAALTIFEQAIAAGDVTAHADWADNASGDRSEHLRAALDAGVPYAMWIEGDRLVQSPDPEELAAGLTLLRTAAEKHQAIACLSLGVLYWRGREGVEVDLDTAMQWLLKGARLGFTTCMYGLACVLRDMGRKSETRRYLTWAALLGDEQGQKSLGSQLILDGTTPEDQAEGIHWLRQSATKGHLPAIRLLGWALYNGQACTAQPEEAVAWFTKGADRGDAECQSSLACDYATGKGVQENPQRAHELFHLASLQGHTHATAMLGQTYMDGHGTEPDIQRAIECFKTAAKDKDPSAAFALGRIYLFGKGVPRDHAAGARWLRDAAHWGSTSAKALLGMMLLYGDGVQENPAAALRWLREAADEGDSDATRELARMLLEGKGVEVNETEGKRLMVKAAALGDTEATEWVRKHCPEQPRWLRDLVEGKLDVEGDSPGEA